ncbi:hypothetical protein P6U22_29420 [Bacillus paranthracis]|uniref:Uncharacterized protein n=1 Tax=Bacillus paranthracis TaxID=2026186 RepID=A0ABT6E900_9BACI|nr:MULTISPECIES: hypothetical protein [Bacillus cereus group]MCC2408692.1 hypothetical protein [Bacillus paranthracis]MDG0939469.1 hypothetical protein [Bacillus paranthracis]MDG0945233.1 hypothetical protein [Bacillus paranthracis]MDG0945237.1 hypothetical protein [Bacillus paranthracis]MDK7514361.1 hypothetical protein [Bacillus paranthracis]
MAKAKNQPNFGMQWKKGGDFLSGFLKKYYLPIAWRKTLLGDIERERKRSLDI